MSDESSSSPPPLVTIKDGAVIATGDAGSAGKTDDYTTQDWKWIEAVLTGSSAVNNKTGVATAAEGGNALVDPVSLRTAAGIFNTAQSVMRGVAKNLVDQANGLAGEGRAWQGKGAEAFLATGALTLQPVSVSGAGAAGASGTGA